MKDPDESTELEPVPEVRKPGRPRGALDTYPRPGRKDRSWEGNAEQTPEVTSEYLHFIREVAGLPSLDISSAKAVQERLDYYMDLCERDGMKPTVTGMCNALGIDRRTLLRWENGEYRSGTHQAIIVKYKRMLEEFWEMQMMNGKINPVSGIFLGKNHFGYADKQEIELAPKDPLGECTDRRVLEQRYLDSMPDAEPDYTTDND